MNRFILAAVMAAASLPAHAHGVAGARIFPATITTDDPAVADEASLPTISYQRNDQNDVTYQTNVSVAVNKRITERFGVGLSYGFTRITSPGQKSRDGFQDVALSLKYNLYVNPEHEFMASIGVTRELGRTGTSRIAADEFGYTQPTLYFGKGLGDVPVDWIRPLAITGTLAYSFADKKLKSSAGIPDPDGGLAGLLFNKGFENRVSGGLAIEYSLPYLQQQVRDIGLPGPLGAITPVLEIAWSSPASRPHALGTQLIYAPGFIYSASSYQFGIEALIPGNRASGTNVGVIAQFHVFLDDLFPTSIGRPLF